MPHTINGIGTWYYGKRNRQTLHGACEHCGVPAALESYDTTSYFVLLFVPVLPLGKKRIMSQCPRCQRHRVMSLGKWEQMRAETIARTLDAAAADTADPTKTRAALEASIVFDDEGMCLEAAALAETHHLSDAATLATLGDAYSYFHHHNDAESMYRESLALERDAGVSGALAVTLMRQGRPHDAAPLVEQISEEEQGIGLSYLLVEAYQEQGDHETAMAMLRRCETLYPSAAKSANHKRLARLSKKHAGTSTAVAATGLRLGTKLGDAGTSADAPSGGLARFFGEGRLAALLAAIAIPALFAGWMYFAYSMGQGWDVHVINGTRVPYDVVINGTQYSLSPQRRKTIKLPEGEITVDLPGGQLGAQVCEIETDFFTRPFLTRTFVLNPDGTALIVREETSYATSPSISTPDDLYEVDTGRLLYVFNDIDFEFREFPDEITMSNSTARRSRVDHQTDVDPNVAIFLLSSYSPSGRPEPAKIRAYVEQAIRFAPDHPDLFDQLPSRMTHEELVAMLEPRLSERPHRLEWHRAYQDTMRSHEPEVDLLARYEAELATNPNDPALMYLHARLLDEAETETGFLRAIDHGLTSTRPFHWLVVRMQLSGRHAESLKLLDRIEQSHPGHFDDQQFRRPALVALGRLDEALALDEMSLREYPGDGAVNFGYVGLLRRAGQKEKADEVISQYLRSIDISDDMRSAWSMRFDADERYLDGDAEGYGSILYESGDGWLKFCGAVTLGHLEEAKRLLEEDESAAADANDYMMLAIAATRAGDTALATESAERAAAFWLESGEPEVVAEWLTGTSTPDPDELYGFLTSRPSKLLLVTLMGQRHPEHRAEYYDLARRLNFDRNFPYLMLEPILAEDARTVREES